MNIKSLVNTKFKAKTNIKYPKCRKQRKRKPKTGTLHATRRTVSLTPHTRTSRRTTTQLSKYRTTDTKTKQAYRLLPMFPGVCTIPETRSSSRPSAWATSATGARRRSPISCLTKTKSGGFLATSTRAKTMVVYPWRRPIVGRASRFRDLPTTSAIWRSLLGSLRIELRGSYRLKSKRPKLFGLKIHSSSRWFGEMPKVFLPRRSNKWRGTNQHMSTKIPTSWLENQRDLDHHTMRNKTPRQKKKTILQNTPWAPSNSAPTRYQTPFHQKEIPHIIRLQKNPVTQTDSKQTT